MKYLSLKMKGLSLKIEIYRLKLLLRKIKNDYFTKMNGCLPDQIQLQVFRPPTKGKAERRK